VKYTLYDWYQDWNGIKNIMEKYSKNSPQNMILNLGCGNSDIGEKMWKDHLGNIVNIDYSESVINYMKERFVALYSNNEDTCLPPMSNICYLTMDATKMAFEDEKFDIIFDKGTLDAILNKINLLHECYRVLKKGGYYFIVSHSEPSERDSILGEFSWKIVEWIRLMHPATNFSGSSVDHVYILKKDVS